MGHSYCPWFLSLGFFIRTSGVFRMWERAIFMLAGVWVREDRRCVWAPLRNWYIFDFAPQKSNE